MNRDDELCRLLTRISEKLSYIAFLLFVLLCVVAFTAGRLS